MPSAARSKKVRLSLVKEEGFIEIRSAHLRKIIFYYAKNISNLTDYPSFLESIKPALIKKLSEHVSLHPIKFNLKLEATYNRPNVENSSENRAFKTSAREVFSDTDIGKIVEEKFTQLLAEEDTYTSKGSGFTLQHIDGLLLDVYKYTSMTGSSLLY